MIIPNIWENKIDVNQTTKQQGSAFLLCQHGRSISHTWIPLEFTHWVTSSSHRFTPTAKVQIQGNRIALTTSCLTHLTGVNKSRKTSRSTSLGMCLKSGANDAMMESHNQLHHFLGESSPFLLPKTSKTHFHGLITTILTAKRSSEVQHPMVFDESHLVISCPIPMIKWGWYPDFVPDFARGRCGICGISPSSADGHLTTGGAGI